MTKIILILWTLSPTGQIDRLIFEGWNNFGDCHNAAEMLTAPHPDDGWSPGTVVRCIAVPK